MKNIFDWATSSSAELLSQNNNLGSISINIPDLLELNCRLTRAIDTVNGLSIHN